MPPSCIATDSPSDFDRTIRETTAEAGIQHSREKSSERMTAYVAANREALDQWAARRAKQDAGVAAAVRASQERIADGRWTTVETDDQPSTNVAELIVPTLELDAGESL